MNFKKTFSMILLTNMIFSSVAATNTTESTSPGDLSSSVIIDAEALTFSVTVPTVLPINVDENGNITYATEDSVFIQNNSAGPVVIKDITIEEANGWTLVEESEASTIKNQKVGSRKFYLEVEDLTDTSLEPDESVNIVYSAALAPQAEAINEEIANVIFTVGWDLEEDIVIEDIVVEGTIIDGNISDPLGTPSFPKPTPSSTPTIESIDSTEYGNVVVTGSDSDGEVVAYYLSKTDENPTATAEGWQESNVFTTTPEVGTVCYVFVKDDAGVVSEGYELTITEANNE